MPRRNDANRTIPGADGLVELFGKVWGEAKRLAPGASRASVSIILRGLATNKDVLEYIGRRMAEDEDIDWTVIPIEHKRNWRARAESALTALNAFVVRRTAAQHEHAREMNRDRGHDTAPLKRDEEDE